MAFPSSPTDGLVHTTNSGVVYRYSTASNSWEIVVESAPIQYGVMVSKTGGGNVDIGGYYAELNAQMTAMMTRFVSRVISGTGTIDVEVQVDGASVHGPVTIGATETATTGLTIAVAAGQDVTFHLSNLTGTVEMVWADIDRGA